VKEKVPVHLGDLKESIMYKVRTRKGSKAVPNVPTGSVEVGPGYTQGTKGRSPGVYGMFVEFGLNARKYLKHPFLRPTFDSTSDKVIQVFADAMQEGLKDVVKEDDWH
jgi:HK97 gp10 family phage protein